MTKIAPYLSLKRGEGKGDSASRQSWQAESLPHV